MHTEDQLRNQLVEFGRRAYNRGFLSGTDGNLSARLGESLMLTTPSGVHKGTMTPDQVVKCDLMGNLVEGSRRPSSEIRMHVLVYGQRPDVRAAIHAHPVHAVALSLVGISLADCLLPEPALALGSIPTAPYATPTTEDVPESIREFLAGRFNALILSRHGTLTLGDDLEQAFLRLETVEHTARITTVARSIGLAIPLPAEEVARIDSIARALGLARPASECSACGACGGQRAPAPQLFSHEAGLSAKGVDTPLLPLTQPGDSPSQQELKSKPEPGPVGPVSGEVGQPGLDEGLVESLTSQVLRRLEHNRVLPTTPGPDKIS